MEHRRIELRCITPLFVGSGEVYNRTQYIYDSEKGEVYPLHEREWIRFLAKNGLMDSFFEGVQGALEVAQKKNKNMGNFLYTWLQRTCLPKMSCQNMSGLLERLKKEGVIGKAHLVERKNRSSVNDIHLFHRENGVPVIPGSTLKGAFRTAILAMQLIENHGRYRDTWTKLRVKSDDKKYYGKVMDTLEQEMTIPLNEDEKRNMVDSYFRGLSVSDAIMTRGNVAILKKVDRSDTTNQKRDYYREISLFRECVTPESTFTFTISLDPSPKGMGHFGIHSVDELLKIVRDFLCFQFSKELFPDCFYYAEDGGKQICDDFQRGDVLLGGGTGFISKTLDYPLAMSSERNGAEKGYTLVSQILSSQFKRGGHKKAHELAPHTLKLTRYGGRLYLMGLASLEVQP